MFVLAAEWLLQCVICNSSDTMLDSIRDRCETHIVLRQAVFSTFPPDYICAQLDYFTDFISQDKRALKGTGEVVDENQTKLIVRKSELYRILGEKCLHGRVKSAFAI